MDTYENKPATKLCELHTKSESNFTRWEHTKDETKSVQLEPISSVCNRTGMGKSWIYERIAEGKFPQIIKIGRRTLFIQQEITDWINARIEENRGAI